MEAVILILLGVIICAIDIWLSLVVRLVRRISAGGGKNE